MSPKLLKKKKNIEMSTLEFLCKISNGIFKRYLKEVRDQISSKFKTFEKIEILSLKISMQNDSKPML